MRTVRLGDVCQQARGSVKPGACPELRYIGLESIESGSGMFAKGELSKTPETPLANSFRFSPEHVLYGKLRPYLNKVAVPDFEGKCSTEIIPLLPNSDIEREYLAYFLRSGHVVDLISSRTAGARMPRADMDFIFSLPIPLPPLPEQRRIVDLLSRAEGIVRLRREAEKKAAELIPALFLDMFGDPGRNPKGWDCKTLGEFCRIIGGSSLPAGEPYSGQEGGLLLMKVSDMNAPGNEVIISSCKEWITEQKRTYSSVSEGTIVFPKRGAAIATNKKRIVSRALLLDPNLMGVLPDQKMVSTDYLFQWFSAFDLADISSGTTVPQLNKCDLTPLVVPLPPLSLQGQFAIKRAAVMSIQAQQASATEKAKATFDVLLARAFSDGQK